TNDIRELARNIIGPNDFIEVFLSTPLDVCEKRDTKGLYKRARAGEIKDFTGISAPFDKPACPDIELDTSKYTVRECVDKIFNTVIDRITL
ncbi:MAG: adenylyl-sulfate kinase, partial [Bacteroidales bacterium]|nr:adenylyl-sulfate kinase [Bacteroidales bacterium]